MQLLGMGFLGVFWVFLLGRGESMHELQPKIYALSLWNNWLINSVNKTPQVLQREKWAEKFG